MEYSIQKLEKSRVEIAVSVDKAEWKDLIQQAFIKNKSRFSIEGFRPGKVPFGVLAKRYGEEIFYEDAADLAIGKHYGDIVEKEKLNVVARPDVDINVIDADGLKFVCTVAVYPEFELGAYTGLKIKKVARRVKKEDVTAEIDREREANARFIDVTDRAVQEGDMIEFDYLGSVDGVKFDGGTAEKYTLTVGSKQFIPGFEDQLVGKKIGEKFDVNVTFPEDYHAEDLKGKAAKFECLIHTIKYKELPVADDEFAKDLGEFDTFKEYEASVKARLQKKADDEATAKEDEALLKAIMDATSVELPDAMIEDELDRQLEGMKASMSRYGLKFEDYLKYMNTTVDDIRKERRAQAETDCKTGVVLEAIVKKENLIPTKEEFEAELKKQADEAGKSVEEYTKDWDEYRYNYTMNKLVDDKLFKFLRENNEIA